MPKEARELMGEGITLFDVCQTLHGHNLGYADSLDDKELSRLVNILVVALRFWHDSPKYSKAYDECVKNLVSTTIVETYQSNLRFSLQAE